MYTLLTNFVLVLFPVHLPQAPVLGTGEWQVIMDVHFLFAQYLLLLPRSTKLYLVKTIGTGPTVLTLLAATAVTTSGPH